MFRLFVPNRANGVQRAARSEGLCRDTKAGNIWVQTFIVSYVCPNTFSITKGSLVLFFVHFLMVKQQQHERRRERGSPAPPQHLYLWFLNAPPAWVETLVPVVARVNHLCVRNLLISALCPGSLGGCSRLPVDDTEGRRVIISVSRSSLLPNGAAVTLGRRRDTPQRGPEQTREGGPGPNCSVKTAASLAQPRGARRHLPSENCVGAALRGPFSSRLLCQNTPSLHDWTKRLTALSGGKRTSN